MPHEWHSTRVSFIALLSMHIPMAQTVFLDTIGQYIFDISVQNMQECLDPILVYPCSSDAGQMILIGLSNDSNADQMFPIGLSNYSDAGYMFPVCYSNDFNYSNADQMFPMSC